MKITMTEVIKMKTKTTFLLFLSLCSSLILTGCNIFENRNENSSSINNFEPYEYTTEDIKYYTNANEKICEFTSKNKVNIYTKAFDGYCAVALANICDYYGPVLVGEDPIQVCFKLNNVVTEAGGSFIYDDKFMFVDNFVLKSKDLSDPKSLIKVEFPVALRHGREVFNAFKKQDDSLYVSNANVEDLSSEYRIFNVRSGAEVSYGKMPDWDENLNMPIDKQIAYMKAICVHPSDGRKMMFYCHYPVVRIYSSSGQLERQVCVGTNSPGSIQKDDKTIYFTEPYVTSEYVYVMWIKRTKKDVGMNVESFSPEILVFDWSGNVVNRYKLDKPVVTIAVKDNTLYATSFIDMNQIYIYDLLPASNAELTPYSNDFLSFKMLSEYPMSKASRKNFEELDFEEKDGYKRIYYYFFNREKGEKKKQDLGSLCITYACSSQEDDIQLDSYLDYLKNRPQVKPLSYIELEPFDSNGRSVYPIQKLIARFNPSLNRNDSVYATEYYLKEKNAIISLDVFSDCKDVPLQKYSKEIRRIIDSMCIK